MLGQTESMPSPGYAEFTLGGKPVRLDGVLEDPHAEQLFFILRDQTSGKETYRAGRFLYADLPKAGKVVLDFNKAYNPPCAFTAYATCPLPPPQNWMPVRVEAGEMAYGKGIDPRARPARSGRARDLSPLRPVEGPSQAPPHRRPVSLTGPSRSASSRAGPARRPCLA